MKVLLPLLLFITSMATIHNMQTGSIEAEHRAEALSLGHAYIEGKLNLDELKAYIYKRFAYRLAQRRKEIPGPLYIQAERKGRFFFKNIESIFKITFSSDAIIQGEWASVITEKSIRLLLGDSNTLNSLPLTFSIGTGTTKIEIELLPSTLMLVQTRVKSKINPLRFFETIEHEPTHIEQWLNFYGHVVLVGEDLLNTSSTPPDLSSITTQLAAIIQNHSTLLRVTVNDKNISHSHLHSKPLSSPARADIEREADKEAIIFNPTGKENYKLLTMHDEFERNGPRLQRWQVKNTPWLPEKKDSLFYSSADGYLTREETLSDYAQRFKNEPPDTLTDISSQLLALNREIRLLLTLSL